MSNEELAQVLHAPLESHAQANRRLTFYWLLKSYQKQGLKIQDAINRAVEESNLKKIFFKRNSYDNLAETINLHVDIPFVKSTKTRSQHRADHFSAITGIW